MQEKCANHPFIEISSFGSYYSKKKKRKVPGGVPTPTDLYSELYKIKNGKWETLIEELLNIRGEAEQKIFKESQMPSFTPSAKMIGWRKAANAVHTGLLSIDIDSSENLHITDWPEMRDRIADKLQTIVSVCLSARKKGLWFIIKIDPNMHKETFQSVCYDLKNELGIFCDTSCGNIDRLRFVSHDPGAVINDEFERIPITYPSEAYSKYAKEKQKPDLLNVTSANSRELFQNAISNTNLSYEFKDGQKYWYLISLAGFCNCRGMTEEYCKSLVNEKFSSLTDADIITPIQEIYKKYEYQFRSMPVNEEITEMNLLREKLKVDLSKKVSKPQTLIEISSDNKYERFATAGNFSLIIGKAKSRKTFFTCMLLAAGIHGNLLMNKIMPRIEVQKKIIAFDTEQALYDVQLLQERILKLVGLPNARALEIFHLRTLDTEQRLKFIEHVIYNTDDLALVIIDGVRDLIFDINSPEEASRISNKLLKWTEERNIHIVTVLHQNKGDNNARGHVGTELINKAESVLSIAKDSDNSEISIVTPEYFRGKEFKPFAFRIDNGGLPEIIEDWLNAKTERGEGKITGAHQIPDDSHLVMLKKIFTELQPKYADLIHAIYNEVVAFGIKFSQARAKQFKTYYEQRGWIGNIRNDGERYPTYYLIKSD